MTKEQAVLAIEGILRCAKHHGVECEDVLVEICSNHLMSSEITDPLHIWGVSFGRRLEKAMTNAAE